MLIMFSMEEKLLHVIPLNSEDYDLIKRAEKVIEKL